MMYVVCFSLDLQLLPQSGICGIGNFLLVFCYSLYRVPTLHCAVNKYFVNEVQSRFDTVSKYDIAE